MFFCLLFSLLWRFVTIRGGGNSTKIQNDIYFFSKWGLKKGDKLKTVSALYLRKSASARRETQAKSRVLSLFSSKWGRWEPWGTDGFGLRWKKRKEKVMAPFTWVPSKREDVFGATCSGCTCFNERILGVIKNPQHALESFIAAFQPHQTAWVHSGAEDPINLY